MAPTYACLLPSQFDYRPENNGFTLVYNNEQLADVATTWDSPPYEWPIIRSEFAYRGACACCDLCRAQPNPSVSAWGAFRECCHNSADGGAGNLQGQ